MLSVDGISFYSFIHLFNSTEKSKRLSHKVAIVTDDDRYAKQDRSFKNLISKNYRALDGFHTGLYNSQINNRIGNLNSTITSNKNNIKLFSAFKTLEFEIALANIADNKTEFQENLLLQYLKNKDSTKFNAILLYVDSLPDETFSFTEKEKVAILLWKALPTKSIFAQEFSALLESKVIAEETPFFTVPKYLSQSLKHII